MSHELDPNKLPRHVAVIMDGNGRWAKQRLRNRVVGHEEGAESVRAIMRACRDLGIPYLTLYAFSKENWQRPDAEVTALWRLLKRFINSETPELIEREIRVRHIGDAENIPRDVLADLNSL
ncbi:MAG: polyprenyl diphosphate synthase, partial [Acidobacteriota bacterium]